MYAVIKTGGKQYRVAAGEKIKIEQIAADAGQEVTIDEVLAVGSGDDVLIGTPLVAGASVKAKVINQGKHDKVRIFKMRRRKHYQKRQGHRQSFTELFISLITNGKGASASAEYKEYVPAKSATGDAATDAAAKPAAKSADKAAAKTAAKPAAKSADKAAEKAAAKSAEVPAAKPAVKSAAIEAAVESAPAAASAVAGVEATAKKPAKLKILNKDGSDNLELIEGIGPKIAEVLRNNGITTFAQLADASADKVEEMLKASGGSFSLANPVTWAEQSALLRDGKVDEFKALTDALDGGVRK